MLSHTSDLYIFGGKKAEYEIDGNLWRFCTITANWTSLGKGAPTISETAMTAIASDNVFIFGGKTSDGMQDISELKRKLFSYVLHMQAFVPAIWEDLGSAEFIFDGCMITTMVGGLGQVLYQTSSGM